ncbi:MAG: hypothetical protein ACOCYC_02160 [bacterium]
MDAVVRGAALLVVLVTTPLMDAAGQDWRLRSAAEVSVSTLLDTSKLLRSSLDGGLRFAPEVTAETDRFSFTGRVSIAGDVEETVPRIRLEALDLSIFPTTWSTIRVGRFRYLPGTASFISPTNYFLTTDYEALLTWSAAAALQPRDLLQGTVFVDRYFATATVAPGVTKYPLPEPSSPWFPTGDVPQQLSLRIPPGARMELDQIHVEDLVVPTSVSDVSTSIEVGASFRWFDLSLFYFHGQNNTPVLQSELDFPQGLFENYEVRIHPQVTFVDAFGLAATGVCDRVRMFLDLSYSLNEVFNTERLTVDNFTTELAETPWIEGTVGASYRFSMPELLLSVEYHRGYAFGEVERIVTPVLSSALAVDARLQLLDRTLRIQVTGLLSFQDYSWALVPAVTYAPTAAMDISLRAPQFFGEETGELGQFSDNYLVGLTLGWRF